jgi:DNA-binding transcriptional regulator PaaX
MIISDETRTPFTQQIQDYLTQRNGEMASLHVIAKALGIGQSSAREDLTRLVVLGRIRKTGQRSSVQYYIPTDAMLKTEQEGLKPRFQPLKPRTVHHAVIERIRSERSAIKSVY